MANNVTVQVTGGQAQVKSVDCVGDAKRELGLSGNYSATVNGQPAGDQQQLRDYDFVSFAESVKGGR